MIKTTVSIIINDEWKKTSTAVQVDALNQTNEKERSVCKERKRGYFVWPTGKIKSLPYEQVTPTIKTNVAAIQWEFNEGENNRFPVDGPNALL